MQLSRRAVHNMYAEIFAENHFLAAVLIQIMNLNRQVIGNQRVVRIGLAELPQDIAVEIDCCQAADLAEVVTPHPADVLRK